VHRALEKVGYRLSAGKFLGALAKLFFIVLMLMPALDIIGLSQVNSFLNEVLSYIPAVVVAAVILFIASVAADILGDMVHGTSRALGSRIAHLLGSTTRVAIWVFAIIMALSELGIAPQYMYTLFAGFVAMVALAGGLAFGLGGKDAAKDLIDEVRDEIKNKR
jgi:small-conductance mechanosensitive channel